MHIKMCFVAVTATIYMDCGHLVACGDGLQEMQESGYKCSCGIIFALSVIDVAVGFVLVPCRQLQSGVEQYRDLE